MVFELDVIFVAICGTFLFAMHVTLGFLLEGIAAYRASPVARSDVGCFGLWKRRPRKRDKEKEPPLPAHYMTQHEWAVTIVGIVVSFALFILYTVGTAAVGKTLDGRWRGKDFALTSGLLLHVTHTIYETAVYALNGKPAIYYLHHAVVLLNYLPALWYRQMTFWAGWCGLVEATNVPLGVLYLLLAAGKQKDWHALHVANGAALALTFFAFRIVSLSAWLWQYYLDVSAAPEATWGQTATVLTVATVPSTLFILILSLVWWVQILKGLAKAMTGGSGGKAGKAGKGTAAADRRAGAGNISKGDGGGGKGTCSKLD